jgi:hypothetical protein
MEVKEGTLVLIKDQGEFAITTKKAGSHSFYLKMDNETKQLSRPVKSLIPFVPGCTHYKTVYRAVEDNLPQILAKTIIMSLERINVLESKYDSTNTGLLRTQESLRQHAQAPHGVF